MAHFGEQGGKSRAYRSALLSLHGCPGAVREIRDIISNKSKLAPFHAHILAKFINAPSM
jgi:hypothetical protein